MLNGFSSPSHAASPLGRGALAHARATVRSPRCAATLAVH